MDCLAHKFMPPSGVAPRRGATAAPRIGTPVEGAACDEARLLEAILRQDLASFTAKVFHTVNPTARYLDNWHVQLICEYLAACSRGEIKRLIINLPPRSLKSISVSVAWPA